MRFGVLTACFLLAMSAAGVVAQPLMVAPRADRDCIICHLQWVESFERTGAVLLMDKPRRMVVADADSCLGCHDGSVGDARGDVWSMHGHQTRTELPRDMVVPTQLPLEDGELACRTCHTAHSSTGAANSLVDVFFLRMDEETLCRACHTHQESGLPQGHHPLDVAATVRTSALTAHGGKLGTDSTVGCRSCHKPHGTQQENLLVLDPRSEDVCTTCHEPKRPSAWMPSKAMAATDPLLTSQPQRAVIERLGTTVGHDDHLVCLSCHKMHDAADKQRLLAGDCGSDRFCIDCHPDHGSMRGAAHDLAKTAPQAVNRFGNTAGTSGLCGACHGFHAINREAHPVQEDVTGTCTTCHRSDGVAAGAAQTPFDHPVAKRSTMTGGAPGVRLYPLEAASEDRRMACLTCHNPHETEDPYMRAAEPATLCITCHERMGGLVTGKHASMDDRRVNAKGRSASQAGACGMCHAMHGAKGPWLWGATEQAPQSAGEECTLCHLAGGHDPSAPQLMHPAGRHVSVTFAHDVRLPLYEDVYDRQPTLSCLTCHDPHAAGELHVPRLRATVANPAMIRPTAAKRHDGLCGVCHQQTATIGDSLHAARFTTEYASTREDSYATWQCDACHRAHDLVDTPLRRTEEPKTPTGVCLRCHQPDGGGKHVAVAHHPPVVMRNTSRDDTPGFLPLIGQDGKPDPAGVIGCGTCHLPHGRADLDASDKQQDSDAHLRALKTMIRPYRPHNLCSGCHPEDGLTRYLYFHDAIRRLPPASDD